MEPASGPRNCASGLITQMPPNAVCDSLVADVWAAESETCDTAGRSANAGMNKRNFFKVAMMTAILQRRSVRGVEATSNSRIIHIPGVGLPGPFTFAVQSILFTRCRIGYHRP